MATFNICWSWLGIEGFSTQVYLIAEIQKTTLTEVGYKLQITSAFQQLTLTPHPKMP